MSTSLLHFWPSRCHRISCRLLGQLTAANLAAKRNVLVTASKKRFRRTLCADGFLPWLSSWKQELVAVFQGKANLRRPDAQSKRCIWIVVCLDGHLLRQGGLKLHELTRKKLPAIMPVDVTTKHPDHLIGILPLGRDDITFTTGAVPLVDDSSLQPKKGEIGTLHHRVVHLGAPGTVDSSTRNQIVEVAAKLYLGHKANDARRDVLYYGTFFCELHHKD
mmetsp:Transcript_23731/g.38073  ORF Transcript_23731/g.38073 Transcript_23731/m.38073 type:complete len:219 (+) Transcript_23731:609-1265(+)